MSYQHEDESPCIHHRSAFDTIPAPPPDNCHVLKDPVFILSRYGREKLKGLGTDVPARKASEPTMLSFRGGEVEVPKPTREALMLSAKQWVTRIREELVDQGIWRSSNPINGALDRLDATLQELAEYNEGLADATR